MCRSTPAAASAGRPARGGEPVLPDYRDINRRLGEPLWYDEHGVPRYDPFHPDLCGVYNDFVALMLVACQSCGRRFRVAWGVSTAASKLRHEGRAPRLPTAQDSGSFGYGDPPRHDGDGGRPDRRPAVLARRRPERVAPGPGP